MQVNIIMQKDKENTIANAISKCLEDNAKKAYFLAGNFKETGFKMIEEDLIDIKTKLFFAIGIDKKTTTRNMLESLITYTDDVYYYSNNDLQEFVDSIYVFEYANSAVMYVCSTNMSESGIDTDLTMYTEIIFDFKDAKDKADYKEKIKALTKIVENPGFNKLDKAAIVRLVENKEIFSTRQYNHTVMSISELLSKKPKTQEAAPKKEEMSKEEIDDVFVKDIEIPKVDLSDISIDIDIPEEEILREVPKKEVEEKEQELNIDYEEEEVTLPDDIEAYEEYTESEVDKDNELYDEELVDEDLDMSETLDINDMLFSKADLKLDIKEEKTKKSTKKSAKKVAVDEEEEELVKVKKVNLNNVTNLIFELPAKNAKEADKIKVQNYVKTMIPEFFGIDECSNEEVDGSLMKVKHIKVSIVDAKTNEKYEDDDAMMTYKAKQSFLTFVSSKLANVEYDELDLVRIIKISDNEYEIEVIAKDMQEYKVWSKLCNQNFRASTKKFGMM